MSNEPMLEARGIRKRFPGTLALDGVNLVVREGEIHALMGENGAGKSTLLNILTGSLTPDEGDILVRGRTMRFQNPMAAQEAGIAIVHQELSLFQDVSVMENILAGMTPSRLGIMNRKKMSEICRRELAKFSANISVHALVKDLSVSQQQIVEIVKAIVRDADIYIFDEPTSALSVDEAERLFVVLRALREKGKSIIYVSHKFDEIFALCNRISVLRDGQLIGTNDATDLTPDDVIRMMVGRSLERIYPEKGAPSEERLLEVTGLQAGEKCRNVSFDLRKGEILGIFGLVGSGRTEIVQALTGILPRTGGQIKFEGRDVELKTIQDSIRNGIYYLTEDRKTQGLFLTMSIRDNVSVVHLRALSNGGFMQSAKASDLAASVSSDLKVKSSSTQQLVGSLSGGNQQKLMIGKWLSKNPRVLILDEPTRGIDIGAKADIHQLLRELANDGIGIIVISSELPEVVGLSNRVMVIHNGAVTGVLAEDEIRDELIMEYASGLKSEQPAR